MLTKRIIPCLDIKNGRTVKGVNFVDFYPTNPGLMGHGSWFNEYVNIGDHYNAIPALSKVTVGKPHSSSFS